MNIYGEPSCTYEAFKNHLAHSSAFAEAHIIWGIFTAHKVDPAVALGFFHHESSCGNKGRAFFTRSWGNLRFRAIYYDALPYAVADQDGFCSYPSYSLGARHFVEHLLGVDGTDYYHGLLTVEEVVPKWAPSSDGNVPAAYIAAVENFVNQLGGRTLPKPRVLIVAGHNGIQGITQDGLCDYMDKEASVAQLRGGTGARGETAYVGDFVQRLTDALRATGLVDAQYTDCVYHVDLYNTIPYPDLVLAAHFHRDTSDHSVDAMFSRPDPANGYHGAEASAESQRFVERIVGGYEKATGIPVTQDRTSAGMKHYYLWCYLALTTQAVILELGNANVDYAILYDNTGMNRIVTFIRDCVIEHFNLAAPTTPPPQRRAGDQTPPAQRTVADIARDLEALAAELKQHA